ncbi:arsenate reductase ArsC [Stutzerimonas kunmingensis]|uniref:arsenate reductase ArsC n=1 Tax=Stutzerimonas kunmingensis TaxID=1211807 RepID=UPI002106D060|nr:arsenate reductase ArsC [Stutzerimonas kunmingensis]MCQ2036324.1 arsenate reductase ArsC [Stutzerimonas kunmingensis]
MHQPIRVLFLCDGNADRSQMAEGLLRHLEPERYAVYSAGIEAKPLAAMAVAVMQELGIDISQQHSTCLNDLEDIQFDYVVTLCEQVKSSCLAFPRDVHNEHWPCSDPGNVQGSDADRLAAFRQTRDEIHTRLRAWLSEAKN